jgi:hypothetical protein
MRNLTPYLLLGLLGLMTVLGLSLGLAFAP